MTTDQAIATLREFRGLTLGPELSAAIDVVVAEHERRVLPMAPKHNMQGGSMSSDFYDGVLMNSVVPRHNMADAA